MYCVCILDCIDIRRRPHSGSHSNLENTHYKEPIRYMYIRLLGMCLHLYVYTIKHEYWKSTAVRAVATKIIDNTHHKESVRYMCVYLLNMCMYIHIYTILWKEPQSGPKPLKTLTTPGGNPASLISWHIIRAVKGVFSLLFNTQVQPCVYFCRYVSMCVCMCVCKYVRM